MQQIIDQEDILPAFRGLQVALGITGKEPVAEGHGWLLYLPLIHFEVYWLISI